MQWISTSLGAISLITLFASPITAAPTQVPTTVKVESDEEAFFVRRIAEFWKDEDYDLVKRHIYSFLEKYPLSPMSDHLRGLLGDLYIQESNYEKALEVYKEITDHDAHVKTIINKLQCYYELSDYESIVTEGKPVFGYKSQEIEARQTELNFLVAEALFRQALASEDSSVKQDNAQQARPLYESILDSSFSDHAHFALAEIYSILGEHEKAAEFYLTQAARHHDRREELLYHAAIAQSEFDKPSAIDSFGKVIVLEGTHKKDALINRLILFFQEDRFEDVVKYFPDVTGMLSEEQAETFNYIVGRSYFALEDHANSTSYLGRFVATQIEPTPHFKNALLMQLTSAQKIEDQSLFEESISRFREHFVDDVELQRALFIHAMILKGQGEMQLAEAELAEIMNKYPNFEDQENLLLEHGLVTHDTAKWKASYTSLKNYLSLYPEGEQSSVAWKYFLSSSLNYLKETDADKYEYSKKDFYNDLTAVLEEHKKRTNILNADEERECKILFAKTAFELGDYQASLDMLSPYLEEYEEHTSIGEAYFLTGLCHQRLHADPKLFCSYTEKALTVNPELNDNPQVHLQLYNAYLSQVEASQSEAETAAIYNQAADHLYSAVMGKEEGVKLENRMWLANHYYEKGDEASYERAMRLYRNALTTGEDHHMKTLNEKTLFLEGEALKYANILGRTHHHSEKVILLKDLVSQQHGQQLGWKYQKQALLELAKTYEMLGEKSNALETFQFLTHRYAAKNSFVTDYASLHEARLVFSLTPREYRTGDNEEIIAILDKLKELQIKKSAETEPMHLEAAFDYASVRAQLAAEEDQSARYAFFLSRLRDDFLSESDPMSLSYREKLASLPEKQEVFNLHMKFLAAEELRIQAEKAYYENRSSAAEELCSSALGLLTEVKGHKYVTPYLMDRVRESSSKIEALNAY